MGSQPEGEEKRAWIVLVPMKTKKAVDLMWLLPLYFRSVDPIDEITNSDLGSWHIFMKFAKDQSCAARFF